MIILLAAAIGFVIGAILATVNNTHQVRLVWEALNRGDTHIRMFFGLIKVDIRPWRRFDR